MGRRRTSAAAFLFSVFHVKHFSAAPLCARGPIGIFREKTWENG